MPATPQWYQKNKSRSRQLPAMQLLPAAFLPRGPQLYPTLETCMAQPRIRLESPSVGFDASAEEGNNRIHRRDIEFLMSH